MRSFTSAFAASMVFLSLLLGQLDDAGFRTIGHEVARHLARGTYSPHRLRWMVQVFLPAAQPGVRPRRNEVFFLEQRRIVGQIHALK